MERRVFLGALSGLGMLPSLAGAAPEKKTRFYVLEQMFLKNGSQLPRIHETIGKTMLPLLNAVHTGPKIYLEALVAPHLPQFAAIYGFESLEDMWGTHVKLAANEEFRKKSEEFESGPEPPFEHQTNTLLLAADYSPEIVAAPASAPPRIFELRTYHSPTWRQLPRPARTLRRPGDQDLRPQRHSPDPLHLDGIRRERAEPDVSDSVR